MGSAFGGISVILLLLNWGTVLMLASVNDPGQITSSHPFFDSHSVAIFSLIAVVGAGLAVVAAKLRSYIWLCVGVLHLGTFALEFAVS